MGKLAITGGTPVRAESELNWPRTTAADIEAVTEALHAPTWCRINGHYANTFEREFADFQGAAYAVAVNSGTSALELGLLALGIKPGDEVILSPYTFMASAASVLVTRGVPVFVDIDSRTYNIDPIRIEEAITNRTFAIMPVHFGGRSCDMDAILEIAQRHDLKVIEDASHAHGANWKGIGLGTMGDVGAFSLGSGKNLTSGEGGILLTNREEIYWRAAELHDLWTGGLVQRSGDWGGGSFTAGSGWTFPQAAPNYRLAELLAALLGSRLRNLEAETQRRADNGNYLNGLLAETDGVGPLNHDPRITRNSYHIFIFKYWRDAWRDLDRELFVKALKAEGIPAGTGYKKACHRHPLFTDVGGRKIWPYNRPMTDRAVDYTKMDCPQADRVCDAETIWFTGSFMLDGSREEMERVVHAIEKIRRNRDELNELEG